MQCSVPGRCNGLLIEVSDAGSSDECLESCQANQNCQWMTFDNSDGNCVLLENCPILTDDCNTCLSSQRHCSAYEDSTGLKFYANITEKR